MEIYFEKTQRLGPLGVPTDEFLARFEAHFWAILTPILETLNFDPFWDQINDEKWAQNGVPMLCLGANWSAKPHVLWPCLIVWTSCTSQKALELGISGAEKRSKCTRGGVKK